MEHIRVNLSKQTDFVRNEQVWTIEVKDQFNLDVKKFSFSCSSAECLLRQLLFHFNDKTIELSIKS